MSHFHPFESPSSSNWAEPVNWTMMTIQITVSHFMEESERGEKNGKERPWTISPWGLNYP